MRVIQINAVNGKGSTGNIAKCIHEQLLKNGEESYVFWGISNTDLKDPHFVRIGNNLDHKLHAFMRRLDLGQGFHSKLATKIACKKIKRLKPDVVHFHNLHSNYIDIIGLMNFLKKQKIPVLLTLHDCWFMTGYCAHYLRYDNCQMWKNGCKDCPAVTQKQRKRVAKMYAKKKKAFEGIENLNVNGVSKWTSEASKEGYLSCAKINTHIYNWVDISTKPSKSRDEVCELYGLDKSKKIVLAVAQGWSPNNKKGGGELISIAERLHERVEVVLVGKNNGMPQIPSLHCIGYTSSKQELIDLYGAADVLANPSRFETFGLVNVEALACGTPVIAYNNTSAIELIRESCGVLVEDGNKELFVKTVEEFLQREFSKKSTAYTEYIKENFDLEKQVNKYISLYREILENSIS